MAHKYKRNGSPYWWIKTSARNPGRFSTGFRIGRKDETDKAEALEAELTFEERRTKSAHNGSKFELWVEPFMENHYSNSATLLRVRRAWKMLRTYLHTENIYHPEHVRREHCLNYLDWRLNKGHGNSPDRKRLSRNTAILELKLFGKIMSEAVHRGWIEYNVAYRLGLERARTKERAEMTDKDVAVIRQAIAEKLENPFNDGEKKNALVLHRSFEIALRQGIRLSETHFNLLEQVNMEAGELTLRAKGKDDLIQPINPDLIPFLQQLIDEGNEWTYEQPRMLSLVWFKFFNALRTKKNKDGKLAHPELARVSFHSTRVRVISRLERSGAPEPVVKKLVNHASTTVHRIYRRVKRTELDPYWSALRSPSSPLPTAQGLKGEHQGKDASTLEEKVEPSRRSETGESADSQPSTP